MKYPKNIVKQVLWLSGVGNISFYSFDGIGFLNDGTPVLFTSTPKKVPLKVRKACEGKKIKIVEMNTRSKWVTAY